MISFSRRQLFGAAAAASTQFILPAAAQNESAPAPIASFSFDEVIRRAQELSAAPFDASAPKPPAPFDALDYDAWRDIRFKRDQAFLAGGNGGFRLETFHLGFLYGRAVTINTIRDGIATPIPYAPALFDFGRVKNDKPLPVNTGFAGFRLLFPLNDPHVHDEAISFLGASYFRFLGRDQQYGLSARGLCVEAGTSKESFPFFREFWITTPTSGNNQIMIFALLDSEATTGAYKFTLNVGPESVIEIDATLFPRRSGIKLGFAPLTSMFLSGENDRRVRDGFRNELHDSDGLLIHGSAGEWLWRPINNPQNERISSFLDMNTKGFGLLQRDRAFQSYQDLDLAYEKRPSYFVEPLKNWGRGRVELIELPTLDETNDNVVASWTPDVAPQQGKAFSFSYRITAGLEMPRLAPNGRVVNTFEAPARALGSTEPLNPNARRFLVDFAGGDLAYYLADPKQVQAIVSTTHGRVTRADVTANPHIDGLRAMIDVVLNPGETTDLRLFLRVADRTLTETWTYLWSTPV